MKKRIKNNLGGYIKEMGIMEKIRYCKNCNCMTKTKVGYIYVCGKCDKDRRFNSPHSSNGLEHRTSKPKVEGSSPSADINLIKGARRETMTYYMGLFGSLKHNILLMLSQIEGNIKYADKEAIKEIKEDLEFINSRIADIIKGISLPENLLTQFKDNILEGCGKDIPMFYSEMNYIVKCGTNNSITKEILYCDECKVLADMEKEQKGK